MTMQTNRLARSVIGLSLAGIISLAVGTAQATTTADEAHAQGVWNVESGQWLGRIVAALELDPTKRTQLMEEIVFLNPQAFANADPNRMFAGASLKLPGTGGFTAQPSLPAVSNQAPVTTTEETITQAERIGRITGVRGQLSAVGSNGKTRSLRRRSYVRQGDTLSTGANGGAQVKFNDGAQIALRRDSSLRIDEYRWQGNSDGSEKAVLSLVKGGFRTITGAIGKVNKANYRVSTPFATIGIRGTHYALMSCQGGNCAGLPGGNATPDDGLYGGTAFGAIAVNDEHTIGPQQYFHHDGENLESLMGPPAFLFAADTQISDNAEPGDSTTASSDEGRTDESSNSDSFAAEGGTETGALIAVLQTAQPSQKGDAVFTEGEQTAADETELNGFDIDSINLVGDLNGLSTFLVDLYQSLGATNVQNKNGTGDVAYGAAVFPFGGLFEASDAVVDGAGSGFFITGDYEGSNNVLLGLLSTDTDEQNFDELMFFSGPPEGSILATQTVSKPAFTAHLGRWDANTINLFYEAQFDEFGVDNQLATEFVFSSNRTPDSQLSNLSGLGTVNFSSVAGFGSDETGAGFTVGNGDIQFDADFAGMQITQAFMSISDAHPSPRFWSFSTQAPTNGPVTLENDALIELSGICSGCGGGSASASAFIFTTFVGANAEGAVGSFGAQSSTSLNQDAPDAIAGVYVSEAGVSP